MHESPQATVFARAGPAPIPPAPPGRCTDIRISGRQAWVDGHAVILGARAFDVLNLLVRHRDRVVGKRELLDAAWPGLVVEENNLQVQISNLRRVLGHDAITTVPGLGYQLNVPLYADTVPNAEYADPRTAPRPTTAADAVAHPEEPPAPRRRRDVVLVAAMLLLLAAVAGAWNWLRPAPAAPAVPAAGAKAPATTADRSVAVLPFADMSERHDLEYFSEGLSEEVLHLLSKLPEMRVAARTSSFSFKDKSEDLPSIARKLQVANVLEGSVRRSGNSVRITVQLVRADNGYHLWSQTYDRKLGDVFQIQEDVAAAIVQALQLSLLGEALPASSNSRRMDSYALYLQGRSLQMHASTRADWDDVDEYARRAVSADVTFAPAWAFFARTLAARAQLGLVPGDTGWEAAREAATRSLSLDPDLREGQLAIASIVFLHDWNWAAARTQFDAVLRADPGNALALSWSGYLALALGQPDRAIGLLENATAIDPLDPAKHVQLARALIFGGRPADAQIVLHKALALDSGQAFAHWMLARIALGAGDPEGALAELDREPNDAARLTGRAIAYHALGRTAEADAALEALKRAAGTGTASPVALAMAGAMRGDAEGAFADLERAYARRDPECILVGVEPLLAQLRSDARFGAFLRRIGLPGPPQPHIDPDT